MRGLAAPPEGKLDRVLLIESGTREAGELILSRLAGKAGGAGMHLLTCYDTPPLALSQFQNAECFSVHAPEAVRDRAKYARQLARGPYDAVIVLATGSGVLSKWKWLVALQTASRLVLADEDGAWFFVTLRNPAPLLVLALRLLRVGTVPELVVAFFRMLSVPFVLAYLVAFAIAVHVRRALARAA